jgi:hypothetical protein
MPEECLLNALSQMANSPHCYELSSSNEYGCLNSRKRQRIDDDEVVEDTGSESRECGHLVTSGQLAQRAFQCYDDSFGPTIGPPNPRFKEHRENLVQQVVPSEESEVCYGMVSV